MVFLFSRTRNLRCVGLAVLLCLFSPASSFAKYFYAARTDETIPPECRPMDIHQYTNIEKVFIVGPADGPADYFNFRYSLTEKQIYSLHEVIRRVIKGIEPSPEEEWAMDPSVRQIYREVARLSGPMGFPYKMSLERRDNAGSTAEIVATLDIQKHYPPSEYYVTGGIAYVNPSMAGDTMGELDLVVVRRSDCQVVAVGEVKSSAAIDEAVALRASEQMDRFRDYLYHPLILKANPQYRPQSYFTLLSKPPGILNALRAQVAKRRRSVLSYPPPYCPEVFGELGASY